MQMCRQNTFTRSFFPLVVGCGVAVGLAAVCFLLTAALPLLPVAALSEYYYHI